MRDRAVLISSEVTVLSIWNFGSHSWLSLGSWISAKSAGGFGKKRLASSSALSVKVVTGWPIGPLKGGSRGGSGALKLWQRAHLSSFHSKVVSNVASCRVFLQAFVFASLTAFESFFCVRLRWALWCVVGASFSRLSACLASLP